MDLLIPLLAGVGLLSGFLGGLLGIGGGVVIVPALILVFEASGAHARPEITVIAVATSMACIVFTSLSAAYTQFRAGKVRWDLFRRLAPFFVLGSFSAGLLAPVMPAGVLRGLIGVFLIFVSLVMLTSWKPSAHRRFPGLIGGSVTGYGGGLMSGLAGIAGGNIIVPTLVFFNVPVHNATATSSAMGVPIALAAACSYALGQATRVSDGWMLGFIDLSSWLIITLGAVAAAPLGVRAAHRLPAARLRRAFGGLLLLAAARMLYAALHL